MQAKQKYHEPIEIQNVWRKNTCNPMQTHVEHEETKDLAKETTTIVYSTRKKPTNQAICTEWQMGPETHNQHTQNKERQVNNRQINS